MNFKIKESKISIGLLMFFAIILIGIGLASTRIPDFETGPRFDDSHPVNSCFYLRVIFFMLTVAPSLFLIYECTKRKTDNYWMPKMGKDLTEIPENTPFIVMAQREQAGGLFLRLALLDPEDSDLLSEFELKNFFIEEKFLNIEKEKMERLPEMNQLFKVKKRPKYEIKEPKHGEEEISAEEVYYVYDAEEPKQKQNK